MQIRTIRAVYNRPPTRSYNAARGRVNAIPMLSNELHQLENEKKIFEQKILLIEKRIYEVQNEINSLYDTLKETGGEYIERSETPSRLRHITLKY